jgi:hypothetical protein
LPIGILASIFQPQRFARSWLSTEWLEVGSFNYLCWIVGPAGWPPLIFQTSILESSLQAESNLSDAPI